MGEDRESISSYKQAFQEYISVKGSKKRVRFNHDCNDCERVQIIDVIRPSSEMTPFEKDTTWYREAHIKHVLRNAQSVGLAHRHRSCLDQHQADRYKGALASTYASCLLDSPDDCTIHEQCAENLALTMHSRKDHHSDVVCARGLEKITVPMVGQGAIKRRKDAITSVIVAQRALKIFPNPCARGELLRQVSAERSKPARKFAKALGTADAMTALIEYHTSSPQSNGEERLT